MSAQSIGIFDSGLGGLTVLKELKLALPNEKFIYLGDTARTPYGSKGYETIVRYSKECASFLQGKDIKLLVVACNTASSLALNTLKKEFSCPVIGTINQVVNSAVDSSHSKKIAVIGTDATIASGVYEASLKAVDPNVQVYCKPCPLFVSLVEQGMFEGEIVDKVVELYLAELKGKDIDVLILGCTHYPLLKGSIEKYLGPKVQIVECSKAIAVEVKALLEGTFSLAESEHILKKDLFCVTDGVARFNSLAQLFLENSSVSATRVDLRDF